MFNLDQVLVVHYIECKLIVGLLWSLTIVQVKLRDRDGSLLGVGGVPNRFGLDCGFLNWLGLFRPACASLGHGFRLGGFMGYIGHGHLCRLLAHDVEGRAEEYIRCVVLLIVCG